MLEFSLPRFPPDLVFFEEFVENQSKRGFIKGHILRVTRTKKLNCFTCHSQLKRKEMRKKDKRRLIRWWIIKGFLHNLNAIVRNGIYIFLFLLQKLVKFHANLELRDANKRISCFLYWNFFKVVGWAFENG